MFDLDVLGLSVLGFEPSCRLFQFNYFVEPNLISFLGFWAPRRPGPLSSDSINEND